ncbi:Trichome birefringence-like 5 isoform 2 [Hibiscus syriacus]|uniref:Trichome birefringence-like 5 isoform 2 n=1 Tax=Hibiscus syriacus TaxID=106335 RepID=A0A6A2WKS2_HIBSY|nr:Trichome birefringence-like 5 isoform 2 [Hibiscus syriacus]
MDTSSISKKIRFGLTTIFFIVLFFFSILLFTKRTLDPSVSVYQQSFSVTTVPDPPPPSFPPPEPGNLSTNHELVLSVSQADKLDPSSNTTGIDDSLSAPEKPDPTADEVATPEMPDPPPPSSLVVENGEEKKRETCDLYTGTWVKDEEYPIYKPGSCPFIDDAFDCHGNGRKILIT